MTAEQVFQAPDLTDRELSALAQLASCREDLVARYGEGRLARWAGGLRRMSLARNVQASNSIEGYNASLDDVMMAMDGEQPMDANEETRQAVTGYRDAMTYVLQIADDPEVEVDAGLLRSLHFMMIKYDLSKSPGRWRPGPISVIEHPSGNEVYKAPDHERISNLIEAMIIELDSDHSVPVVRAAMAHLNLVMIHPFRDGNGRMARCLQTLALAQDKISNPVFSSIEEYLGRNTPAYYAVLGSVGDGSWNPQRDAMPWVQFCLHAHLHQAETVRRRFEEAERLWESCVQLMMKHHLPPRTAAALWEAARGLKIRRPGYIKAVEQFEGEEITNQSATRDLMTLVHAGLLEPRGETRGRHYVASESLRGVWFEIRDSRPPILTPNPFETT